MRKIVCSRLGCLRDRRKHLLQRQLATLLGQACEGLEEQRRNWVDHLEARPPAQPLRSFLRVSRTMVSAVGAHQSHIISQLDDTSVRSASSWKAQQLAERGPSRGCAPFHAPDVPLWEMRGITAPDAAA